MKTYPCKGRSAGWRSAVFWVLYFAMPIVLLAPVLADEPKGGPGVSPPGAETKTAPSGKPGEPGETRTREAPLGTEVPPQELERRKRQIERRPPPAPRPGLTR